MKKRMLVLCLLLLAGVLGEGQEALFTRADFKSLQWLEGRWEGRATGESPFYEEYRMLNDTALALLSFRDASFTGTPDTGWVYFDNGTIVHRSGRALWKASLFTKDRISFEPLTARNSFQWLFISRNEWQAVLSFTDKEGKKGTKTYSIKRKET